MPIALIASSSRALAFAVGIAALCPGIARADVIDFNFNSDGTYFVPSVTSNGFVATESPTVDGGSTPMGTNVAIDGVGPSNGTVHLDSWTNEGSNSIWTLTKLDGTPFSLNQFDFESGAYTISSYTYAAATGLTVTGTYSGGGTVTQAFGPASTFTTLFLSSEFNNLASVQFDAAGYQNRAGYDNIVVDAVATAVPEPASLALLGMGALGLAAARRRRAS